MTDHDEVDMVVLVDAAGGPVGTAPRRSVHGVDTPRHLAFSVHLLAADGRVLITRRALTKRTWPGVWTNAFCGHPRPGEDILDAVRRRAMAELGASVSDLQMVLPDFSYSARDDSGIVENELCPVLVARLDGTLADLTPDPDEVVAWRVVEASTLADVARRAPWAISPWAARQLEHPALRAAIGVVP